MEKEGAGPEEIDEEEENDDLVDDAIEDQEDKIEEMGDEGAPQQEIDEEKEKLDALNDIADQNDKIKVMEEQGADPEEIDSAEEKLEKDLGKLSKQENEVVRGSLLEREEEMIVEGPHKGWRIIRIEERDCLNCDWRLKDSYFEDKLGIRHETLLPIAEL